MPPPIYVLGTGLSHDGSACILKDGKLIVAIEKERLTRKKHDGGNDRLAVDYCLEAAGITLADITVAVQCANFEKDIAADRYIGKRSFPADFPIVTISHHLAHAYSAIATSPFREANVLVIDGSGSPASQCDDWPDEATKNNWLSRTGYYCEKDSFYQYDGHTLKCLYKDFSEIRLFENPVNAIRMPHNYHSIGGVYAAISNYCFGNLDDAGKLMGLAPYGRSIYAAPIFRMEENAIWVNHSAFEPLQQPATDYPGFRKNFQHYADVAAWVQGETEKAVLSIAQNRMTLFPHEALCYAGGVALNAVANAQLLKEGIAKKLYIQPAAGDNGLAIGCAAYGWHRLLQKELPPPDNASVFFGRTYHTTQTELAIAPHATQLAWEQTENFIEKTALLLAAGKTVAWFQGGSELGPRALGHRSILADPRRTDIKAHINTHIKFREDFRPFAPSVLQEEVNIYFKNGWDSPHMILIDEIKDEWKDQLPGIVHVNGTCRVQTVDKTWNAVFHSLLQQFKAETGIAVLVNTSFNRRGMPIVETPAEAIGFFLSCALDVLVIGDFILTKK